MGLFDLFGREPKQTRETGRVASGERQFFDNRTEGERETKGPVTVFKPSSFADVEKIINCLKSGKTAIVHLTELKQNTSIRILDLLSGAVYALNGGVYEMQSNIFMFSPSGVEIN